MEEAALIAERGGYLAICMFRHANCNPASAIEG
jgi:hypothetical protein